MSEWQPIDTAPKDQVILLYGRIDPSTEFEKLTWEKPAVFSGYWCWMDDAWCPSGGTWAGPFMEVTHWMPLPQPPEEGRT